MSADVQQIKLGILADQTSVICARQVRARKLERETLAT
jgi:hypothetical protein